MILKPADEATVTVMILPVAVVLTTLSTAVIETSVKLSCGCSIGT
jgi:hypothetical protein